MNTDLYDLQGKKIKTIALPQQFTTEYEPDLIKRSIVAFHHSRKPYGTMYQAGLVGVSAKISRRRRNYKCSYGHGISRAPRKTLWRRGTQFGWTGSEAPGTVKGRMAHPPKPEKIYTLKINKKERKKALRSALSGIAHHHKLFIVEARLEALKKTKEARTLLQNLGFTKELERLSQHIIKAGKGKTRGRRHSHKKGPLFVVAGPCPFQTAAYNLPGIDVLSVKYLNIAALTRANELRTSIWTENALKKLDEEHLFL
ncbi:MAG TPA: 50S ribosomal protein L4 [Candidatus Nanoarchaeia archaeon]|nr:50S ribosomal protein L4P [uncultured archaeon]HZX12329.1 50S ribosomal protein L4 [Candidatus Nanoarchaeia archaeon]